MGWFATPFLYMKKLIPVKDVADLYRGENGVIHNMDKEGFNSFIEHRNRVLSEKQRIENLESDVSEIKESIKMILNFLQGNDK